MIFPTSIKQKEFIKKKVEEWINILKLQEYRIIVDFKKDIDGLAETDISFMRKYVMSFPIFFLPDYYEHWNNDGRERFSNWKDYLEELVVHELLHIKLSRLIVAYDKLIPDHILETNQDMIDNKEEEFFVDSLTRILLDLRKRK